MASPASPPFPALSDDKPECGVCLESLSANLAALPCGHVFHQLCATLALAATKKCPICRMGAQHAIRLFYAMDTRADSSDRDLEPADGVSKVIEELGKDVARLNANMRRVSSHSFRLQTENARLRQENARVTAQLEASDAKHDKVARELGVWKRISTSTHAQLRDTLHKKSKADQRVVAEMKEIQSKLEALSVCSSCEQAANESKLQLHDLSQLVESAADKKQQTHCARKMACCTVESASRALRIFCARHTGAASTSASASTSEE